MAKERFDAKNLDLKGKGKQQELETVMASPEFTAAISRYRAAILGVLAETGDDTQIQELIDQFQALPLRLFSSVASVQTDTMAAFNKLESEGRFTANPAVRDAIHNVHNQIYWLLKGGAPAEPQLIRTTYEDSVDLSTDADTLKLSVLDGSQQLTVLRHKGSYDSIANLGKNALGFELPEAKTDRVLDLIKSYEGLLKRAEEKHHEMKAERAKEGTELTVERDYLNALLTQAESQFATLEGIKDFNSLDEIGYEHEEIPKGFAGKEVELDVEDIPAPTKDADKRDAPDGDSTPKPKKTLHLGTGEIGRINKEIESENQRIRQLQSHQAAMGRISNNVTPPGGAVPMVSDTTGGPIAKSLERIHKLQDTKADLSRKRATLKSMLESAISPAPIPNNKAYRSLGADPKSSIDSKYKNDIGILPKSILGKTIGEIEGGAGKAKEGLRQWIVHLKQRKAEVESDKAQLEKYDDVTQYIADIKKVLEELKPVKELVKGPVKAIHEKLIAVEDAESGYLMAASTGSPVTIAQARAKLKEAIGAYNRTRWEKLGGDETRIRNVDTALRAERDRRQSLLVAKLQEGIALTDDEKQFVKASIFNTKEAERVRLRAILGFKIDEVKGDTTISQAQRNRRTEKLTRLQDSGMLDILSQRNAYSIKLLDDAVFKFDLKLGTHPKVSKLSRRQYETTLKAKKAGVKVDEAKKKEAAQDSKVSLLDKQIEALTRELNAMEETHGATVTRYQSEAAYHAEEIAKRQDSTIGTPLRLYHGWQQNRKNKKVGKAEVSAKKAKANTGARVDAIKKKIEKLKREKLGYIQKETKFATKQAELEAKATEQQMDVEAWEGRLPMKLRFYHGLARSNVMKIWKTFSTGISVFGKPWEIRDDNVFMGKVLEDLQGFPSRRLHGKIAPSYIYTGKGEADAPGDHKTTDALSGGAGHDTTKPPEPEHAKKEEHAKPDEKHDKAA